VEGSAQLGAMYFSASSTAALLAKRYHAPLSALTWKLPSGLLNTPRKFFLYMLFIFFPIP